MMSSKGLLFTTLGIFAVSYNFMGFVIKKRMPSNVSNVIDKFPRKASWYFFWINFGILFITALRFILTKNFSGFIPFWGAYLLAPLPIWFIYHIKDKDITLSEWKLPLLSGVLCELIAQVILHFIKGLIS
ncbi:MAG: hypothetical protein GY755_16770 [Chloroflexi bacterium]|nr:hypothetical protein [Chloroflexota bacterium]